ncbi:hypothetical protein IPM65_06370 [Candidatus Roizmanbacteria bacterium]|nr:MAG: hypothetical protein IPM65_06370 [Candidatus Roizmanbacteria bacterium]
MKLRTILLFVTFAALIAVVVLMFMPYPGQDELMTEEPPVETQPDFNPQYGDLTDEQIAVADRAIGDLLNSVEGLNPSMIAVKSFETREYGSTALDCPQEGQMYAEVITPGYQIVLEAQGEEYDYRLDTNESVIMCQN